GKLHNAAWTPGKPGKPGNLRKITEPQTGADKIANTAAENTKSKNKIRARAARAYYRAGCTLNQSRNPGAARGDSWKHGSENTN
ncbi:MAG TPA: hypothetical protein VFR39_07640, partial [Burkholderiales bacterium]|nr:hypothetical protein [Burkholderiales bacterium]